MLGSLTHAKGLQKLLFFLLQRLLALFLLLVLSIVLLSLCLDPIESSAHILEFEMSPSLWASVLLPWVVVEVDSFVVNEVFCTPLVVLLLLLLLVVLLLLLLVIVILF